LTSSVQARRYNIEECVVFRVTSGPFGGLSNMCSGYPLLVEGCHIYSSEALYQACRYPLLPEVQSTILAQRSPMAAKLISRKYVDSTRDDWQHARVPIMRWCLRVKLLQNWSKFAKLLRATANRDIVEFSPDDQFWGARRSRERELVGCNVLGRLLMELREEIRNRDERQTTVMPPPHYSLTLIGIPIGPVTDRGPKTTGCLDL